MSCKHGGCSIGACKCSQEVTADLATDWEPEQTYPETPEAWKDKGDE